MKKTITTFKEFYERVTGGDKTQFYVQNEHGGVVPVRAVAKKVGASAKVTFEDGNVMVVGDTHAFMDTEGNPIVVKDLHVGDYVARANKTPIKVTDVQIDNTQIDLYDIMVDAPNWYVNDDHGIISHNTCYSLLCAKAYMDKYDDAVLLFYDSEMGASKKYFESFDIDMDRVLHLPITDIENLKFDVMSQLENIKRGDHVIIVVDSVGNLASRKEVEDALEEKSVADMTRAKQMKSLIRMITPHLNLKNIPMIMIAHTYKEMSLFPKDIISGGCVVAGTKIMMANGSFKAVEDIVVGEKVKTLEGDKEVTHTWNPDTLEVGEPECYEVEFEDGFKVVCSDKHRFIVNDAWVEAKDLKVGDSVKQLDGTITITHIMTVGKKKVYDLSVKSAEHYVLENGVVTHNSGLLYGCDQAIVLSRSQEKKGTELLGYNFNLNIYKSRFVREKSRIPMTVLFDGGINKWSGLLEMALSAGFVAKPSNGWYQKVDMETGELIGNKVRLADTNTAEFWDSILKDPKFEEWVEKTFMVANTKMVADSVEDIAVEPPSDEFTMES